MSSLTYIDYPHWGPWARAALGYRQAVIIKDQIHCSGQGGWLFGPNDTAPRFPSTLSEQYDQAFQNVDKALQAAGGTGWNQVFRLNSYHTDLNDEVNRYMVEGFRKYMGEHQVIWTQIGVTKLGAPGMEVELEVVAYTG